MPSRFTQILAGKQGLLSGQDNLFKTKKSSQSCKSRSADFSLFCKLHSCQQSCSRSWTKWAWTIWLCLEIFLPCKCSNFIQVKPIVSNYAPQPKNHWRFSPIGIVQPEVSWISSFLKYRCLLPYAYLDDSRKYYLANSKNLAKKIVFACVCASAEREDSQGQETMTRVGFFNRFGLRRVTCQQPRKGRCPTMSLLMTL